MTIKILSIAVVLSAAFAIFFKQTNNTKHFPLFKILTTSLIISISVIIFITTETFYSAILIPVLVMSLMGDIFLISNRYFLHGLAMFLIAHIGFTIGFASLSGFHWNIIPLIVLLFIGVTYLLFLKRDLKDYLIPVAVYIFVIVMMNWQAVSLVTENQNCVFFSIAVASLLFSFSDSVIAYNKFKIPFILAQPLILSSYWMTIYLFTLSGLYL